MTGDTSPFARVAADLLELFPRKINNRARDLMPDLLVRICIDPKCSLDNISLPGCADLSKLLENYRQHCCSTAAIGVADTEATKAVWETLDYAFSQGGMVLIEGTWRIGKSISAQSWALQHLGECRYVSLSSARDDTAFYRDIARCLGTAHSTQRKASEIRMRVEAMLRTQAMMVVLDESQNVWPASLRPEAPPERAAWLITALLNSGVTVALVASNDFTRRMRNIEDKCRSVFGLEQFAGRLRHRVRLPDSLGEADLFKIAKAVLPEASHTMGMLLVGHALKSKGRLASIECAAARARFFASQDGRNVSNFRDVERAIQEAGGLPTTGARELSAEGPLMHRGSSVREFSAARDRGGRGLTAVAQHVGSPLSRSTRDRQG